LYIHKELGHSLKVDGAQVLILQWSRFFSFLSITLMLFNQPLHARETLGPTPSIRALGMGNAYTALVDDLDSLFYNPAGLAKVHGIQIELFSVEGAAHSLADLADLKKLKSSTSLATDIPPLYGKNYYLGAGGKSGIAVPMFGFAVYDYLNASLAIHNPAFTQIDVSVLNDYGYAAGFGIPLGPFLQMGGEFRRVKRTGTQTTFAGGSLSNLNTTALKSDATNWGIGYALDVGANIVLPLPFATFDLGAAWRDVGDTVYKTAPNAHIPTDTANLTVGLGADIELPLLSIRPALDFRHITEEDIQLFRKFNFGVELGLPLLDIRAGFSEGYYAYGVGLNIGLMQVDFASYGVELGDYPGQLEERRYMAQVSVELDIGSFGVTKDPKQGAASSDGADGTSGSASKSKSNANKSIWGGSSRLKQRR
jgi:hypothetical protein